MRKKYKRLFQNIGLMTISNFSTKILAFLLIPLYTSVLTTEEYGVFDVYSTTAFLLIPLLSVCISDAVMRFSLDRKKDPGEVLSVALSFFVRTCVCIAFLVYANQKLGLVAIFALYPGFFLCYCCLCLLSDIIMQFAWGLERVMDLAIAGFVNTGTTILLNILLLVIIPVGIRGYLTAACAAFAAVILYLSLRIRIWKYIKPVQNKQSLSKEMTDFSKPLIGNQIAWWINNVSDRYIVTWLCGVGANGIYSIAYKIPSILQIIQTIVNQAWLISAVKEMENDGDTMYSQVYQMYNCAMVLTCSALIVCIRIIARILFADEFYQAWQYAPFLLISVVFCALAIMIGGIFTAAKATKTIARTTAAGACINTALNILLVYLYGPIGAAIATLVSWALVWAARLVAVKRLVHMEVKLLRDVLSYLLLLVQAVLLLGCKNVGICYLLELVVFLAVAWTYAAEIQQIAEKLICMLKKSTGRIANIPEQEEHL